MECSNAAAASAVCHAREHRIRAEANHGRCIWDRASTPAAAAARFSYINAVGNNRRLHTKQNLQNPLPPPPMLNAGETRYCGCNFPAPLAPLLWRPSIRVDAVVARWVSRVGLQKALPHILQHICITIRMRLMVDLRSQNETKPT
jgi:hypothetical protein